MVKYFFMYVFPFLGLIALITQYVLPKIFNNYDFAFFKKRSEEPQESTTFKDLEAEVVQSVKQFNKSKQKVEKAEKQVNNLKNKIK